LRALANLILFIYNRVVQKLKFLNNNRLKRQNAKHFAGLMRQPTGSLNKSNMPIGGQNGRYGFERERIGICHERRIKLNIANYIAVSQNSG
jgi:hypothetical protein